YFGSAPGDYREGAEMQRGSIGHAFSEDGIRWERDPKNPILSPRPGQSDAWTVGGPSAIVEEGRIRLWFFGNPTSGLASEIELAEAACGPGPAADHGKGAAAATGAGRAFSAHPRRCRGRAGISSHSSRRSGAGVLAELPQLRAAGSLRTAARRFGRGRNRHPQSGGGDAPSAGDERQAL